jgi:hypothetical protein
MSKYTSTNTNGRCLSKNHPLYGNIYLNLNKNNEYYIRTKNKDIINKYTISDNKNKALKLSEAIKIIENYNSFNDTPIINKNIFGSQSDPNNNNIVNKQYLKTGKILGKLENDNVFLNHSIYNDKYYLKVSKSKDNIPVPHDCNIELLNIDKAKEIIEFHKLYNNKIIGIRENHDIKLKNGCFSLYIEYDKKCLSIPKYVLDDIESLDLDICNKIIDYHFKIKQNVINDTNNTVKKSFLDIVKNK